MNEHYFGLVNVSTCGRPAVAGVVGTIHGHPAVAGVVGAALDVADALRV